jgi:oligoribonuclease NrnB/cAMP/cGMP phosphodiesterase (DHH superfamily)
MKHIDKINAIFAIRPDAEFVLIGDEIQWLDENQTEPTLSEIEEALAQYNTWKAEQDAAKATQKAALLNRLGITEDEAKLLLA